MKNPNHEKIYLIPGSYDGEHCYVWSDDPSPGTEYNPDDAIEYVRADLFNALAAQIEQLQQAISTVRLAGEVCGFAQQSLDSAKAERLAWIKLNEVCQSIPVQCLAEVQAQAGRKGYLAGFELARDFYKQFNKLENSPDKYADYYAYQIRQAAKAGEQ